MHQFLNYQRILFPLTSISFSDFGYFINFFFVIIVFTIDNAWKPKPNFCILVKLFDDAFFTFVTVRKFKINNGLLLDTFSFCKVWRSFIKFDSIAIIFPRNLLLKDWNMGINSWTVGQLRSKYSVYWMCRNIVRNIIVGSKTYNTPRLRKVFT